MKFITYQVDAGPGNTVRVEISAAANVMLVDHSNLSAFRARRRFRYTGGYYRTSPVLLRPPSDGNWYVVVDPQGGAIRSTCEVL